MAKAKNLAGLAALGALGYMLTRDKTSENAGDQKTSSYTGDTKKVEALEDAFIPTNESSYARNNAGMPMQGVGDATDNPLPKQRIKSLAAADRDTKTSMPSGTPDSESGMSRGTRPADRRSAEAGTSRGTRKTSVAGAGRGSVNPASVKPSGARDLESGMSRGTRTPAPSFKGGQPGYDEAGNFLGGSRGYDEAGNPMKKGGKVKKMASGGMTASRRADGIASRGKTKCKMY